MNQGELRDNSCRYTLTTIRIAETPAAAKPIETVMLGMVAIHATAATFASFCLKDNFARVRLW